MCLIVTAVNYDPEYSLILIANRDEFVSRKTAPLHWWKDHPGLIAGRDLEANGTWLGMTREGRIAALTNYRDLTNVDSNRKSRGELPVEFLSGTQGSVEFLEQLDRSPDEYNGYNLIVGDVHGLYHYSNYEEKINAIPDGIHGLSNSLLNTPWPKVVKAKAAMKDLLDQGRTEDNQLLEILADTSLAEDHELPDTGVGYDWEKVLSATNIRTSQYGTCCSTVIKITQEGEVSYLEKTYPIGDQTEETRIFRFKINDT